uniref:Virilizer N-terminal domain-containing protein n=1 Tax=Schizophyllum commune (strain H4-8 / FGSC 9210) TaxID=578458 RepID=D8PQY6_SCHCM
MGLLCWCTLYPQGPSNLAAIRFSAPVRVASIHVFPKGARPFADYEDFTSETAPECFYAELFFNATPIHISERDKNRFPNSLVPTTLAYAGSHVDYTVDMGTEHATRLMIVKGNFKRLSLAVYGDLVSDLAAPKPEPAPVSLSSIEPRPLSAALDLVNAQDASSVATKLMTLLKNPPPLHVILRSQFCLKPDDDTWDHPDYPNVYVDLAEQLEDFKFRAVIYWTRPISETASEEDISAYFSRFARSIDEAALDASKILAVEPLEDWSLEDVLYASANVVIARHLCTPDFLASLQSISSKASATRHRRSIASRIVARLQGWRIFEDALEDADGCDYFAATRFLADIGTEEISLGIWLLCMVQHQDMSERLAQRPLPATSTLPPLCLRRRRREISSDEFTAFLKAFLGTAAVVGVACWADCFANDICFERALAVLHLWQQAPGYSEIVNLILALDQTCRRIKWSMEDRTAPRRTELLAEQILTDLAFEPKAVLRDELVTTILAIQPPLSYITEDTRIAMQKLARAVDDGLQEGVEGLAQDSEHPYTLRRLSVVRVALAMVEQALEDTVRGEWDVIQALHSEKKQGLLVILGDLLKGVVQDLNAHFSVRMLPPSGGAAMLNQLFLTAEDLVAVISPLAGAYPLSSRPLYELATAMAHVIVCAGLVGSAYPTPNTGRDNIRVSARDAELGCLELLAQLCTEDARTDAGKPGAEVVLRALFESALRSEGKDPALHLAGVFQVVERLLPRAEDMSDSNGPSYWVADILPHVLRELSAFFRALDVERKIQLLERLIKLDDGLIGVGEWLLTEEPA